MELVSRRVIEARAVLWDAEAALVPVGKALADHDVAHSPLSTGLVHRGPDTGWVWKFNEDWKPDVEATRTRHRLTHDFWCAASR